MVDEARDGNVLGYEAYGCGCAARLPASLNEVLDKLEKGFLEHSLRRFEGNIAKVAEAMDLTTRAVYLKLKELEVDPSNFRLAQARCKRSETT